MNAYQDSLYKVGQATKGICDENTPVWSGSIPFSDAMTKLNANLNLIAAASEMQNQSTRGITRAKDLMRKSIAPGVLQAAAMMLMVGTLTNDAALVQQGKVTKSMLLRGKADNFVGLCKRVIEAATKVSHLVRDPYGITGMMLTALTDQLDLFIAMMPATRVAEANNVAATKEVKRLIGDLQEILETQLDPAAYLLSVANPEFYQKYLAARVIVDPSYRKRMLQVQVTDKATGAPLQKVKAFVFPIHMEKVTTAKGQFYINTLPSGTYTITFSRAGYLSQEVPVELTTGLRMELEVEMMAG